MKSYNVEKYYSLPDRIKNRVTQSLITHVFQQTVLGQLTSVFCATLIFIALYTAHDQSYDLKIWYITFLTVSIARVVTAGIYLSKNYHVTHFNFWKHLSILGALLGGLCWGFAGSYLFNQATILQQTLIILVLSGITAGAAPLLAAELFTSITFISAVLFPLIYELYYHADATTHQLFAITAVAYFIFLVILSVKLHNVIKSSITLKYENDALLENLSLAKKQLEIINTKLTEAATHDPLTHAANRDLFQTKLQEAIDRSIDGKKLMTLFYIDLDNFKTINDQYGHQVGDQLLLKLVERLRKSVREYDVISRLGGDELTIIFENITEIDSIYALAVQLSNTLAKPVDIQNKNISVTASIGISICPLDGQDSEMLLHAADSAMYTAKNMGRNNFRFYSDKMNQQYLSNLIKPSISPNKLSS